MKISFYNIAKVTKLLIGTLMLFILSVSALSQEDPITEAIQQEKQKEDYFGPNLSRDEFEELSKIYQKYELTDREKELRLKQQRGEKLSLGEKYRLGMANRKDYLRTKKINKLYKKKLMKKQSPEMQERMKKNEKKADRSYKKAKRKQKRKSFFNLFR